MGSRAGRKSEKVLMSLPWHRANTREDRFHKPEDPADIATPRMDRRADRHLRDNPGRANGQQKTPLKHPDRYRAALAARSVVPYGRSLGWAIPAFKPDATVLWASC